MLICAVVGTGRAVYGGSAAIRDAIANVLSENGWTILLREDAGEPCE